MNIEELHDYCLTKKGAVATFPFDEVNLVIKVQGKMFALISLDLERDNIALKCDPEKAVLLREEYEEIIPAPHFNKKYWNRLYTDRELKRDLICELIDHSYDLVVAKLTKKQKEELRTKS